MDCPKLRLWTVILDHFFFFFLTRPNGRHIFVNLDQRLIGLSKITVVGCNFRQSKSTFVERKFGPSKTTVMERNFGPSKITVVEHNFGPSKIRLLNVILDRPKYVC